MSNVMSCGLYLDRHAYYMISVKTINATPEYCILSEMRQLNWRSEGPAGPATAGGGGARGAEGAR